MWLALACVKETVTECSEDKPCPFGSSCVENVCEEQRCATSDQCPIESYCDADHACVEGCQSDDDCRYGAYCDGASEQCVSETCTDARLDCSVGEFCSPVGECYDAGGYYCADCEEDGDCGGGGNICFGDGFVGFCAVTCDGDNDCPAGFDCYAYPSDNPYTHVCWTDCPTYWESKE